MQLDPVWTAITVSAAMFLLVFARELRLWLRDWRTDVSGEGEKDAKRADPDRLIAAHVFERAAKRVSHQQGTW